VGRTTVPGAGDEGALRPLLPLLVEPDGSFRNTAILRTTGIPSASLDDAPTHLVLFNLASGDATVMLGPFAATLKAISMAAVYFGALTYIGNAPNFMVKAIAEDRGVAMPSFFGCVGVAALALLPLQALPGFLAL
jgi:Na+/H+ antiporter NhaD/arsenite permease-like protein